MHDPSFIAAIVGVYLALTGTGLGLLADPLRPFTYGVAAVSVALTGFLVAGLAPDAAPTVPLLVVSFTLTAYVRDRIWRAGLIRRAAEPRTPPPPPPSASATG